MAKIKTTKQVALDTIQTHPDNYNHGDAGAISVSLDELGQYRAIGVSEATGNILYGNHTYLARGMNGDPKMLVHILVADDGGPLSPEEEKRIMVADNRYAQLAYADENLLSEILTGLAKSEGGLIATGYDGDDLDAIVEGLYPKVTYEKDDDGTYVRKVESPIYEPEGVQPPVGDLYDRTVTDRLQGDIDSADLPEDIAAFLLAAAERHTVFTFDRIANYYAHAPAEIQTLMEDSALVIIDFAQAIEKGFVQLNEETMELFREEFPDA